MNKEEYLNIVRKEIKYIFDLDAIEKELNEHIQDSILDLVSDGYSYEDAEIQAVNQMGDPKELGKQLNKEHHPFIGYLYSFTQVIIYLMIVPLLINGAYLIYNLSEIMFEHKTDNYVEIIELDYKVELAGHTFVLDNVCIDDKGEATLNYRSFVDFTYVVLIGIQILMLFMIRMIILSICQGIHLQGYLEGIVNKVLSYLAMVLLNSLCQITKLSQ